MRDYFRGRAVDALVLSAGAADLRFEDILSACLGATADPCQTGEGRTIFDRRISEVEPRLDEVAAKLEQIGIDAGHVFLTAYLDFTRTGLGCIPGGRLGDDEASWRADTVIPELNAALGRAAVAHGWNLVTP